VSVRAGGLRIALIADCGGVIGWGHFVRCHALTRELRGRGSEAHLYVNGELPPFADSAVATATGFPSGTVGAQARDVDAVVLDFWRYSTVSLDEVSSGVLVVAFVDGLELPFEPDLTVDPNVFAEPCTSPSRLAGAQYVMLRPELDFVRRAGAAPASGTLFISFGGTERRELVGRTLAAAAPAFRRVVAVVPALPDGTASSDSPGLEVSWRTAVTDMGALLVGAEAGVIAAGALLHEACAAGLPCAVVALTSDQELEAEAMASRGAIVYLGAAGGLTDDRLRAGIESLRDPSVQAGLRLRSRDAVDGLGRQRIADALLSRLAGRRAGEQR